MSLDQLHLLPEAAQQAILDGPGLIPPEGVIPNFDNPPNQNSLGLAVISVCLSISTLAFATAAYAKLYCMKKIHVEDFLVVSSYGLIVGLFYGLYQSYAAVGYFVHQWDIRVRELAPLFYTSHVGTILYSVAILLLKVAILLQWLRIFVPHGTKGFSYWTCQALIYINALLYLSTVIAICASCKPYRRLWDKTIPGTCIANQEALDVSSGVGNLASDVIILLLPQRVIWKLHIKPQKKVGIAFIFFVGIFATLAAGFRLEASVRYLQSADKAYTFAIVALWGIAELTCAMLIFCVPSIPKIFRDTGVSIKSTASFVPWPRITNRGSNPRRRLTEPSLALDGLRSPNHGYDTYMAPTTPEIDQDALSGTNIQVLNEGGYPKTGILRTTRIVTTSSSGSTMNEGSQFQSPWN
ncbi:hypothetical protein F5Y10DRAFT_251096 [Nemania abortiva]|nr:hypothetical protein F5Y10DRAFT_251096 [Nemania abortiva]